MLTDKWSIGKKNNEMDSTNIVSGILGGMEPSQFVIFYITAILGLLCSIAVHVFKQYRIKPKGSEFNVLAILYDERIRIICTVVVIPAAIIFSDNIMGSSITNWSAFLAGFVTDRTLDAFIAKSS